MTTYQHPWYGLWMRVKGPHHYKVIALGSCVKWPWKHMTITLQALSSMERAEAVQVHFTLRLRDQRSMWMQDNCKVYMDSYMAIQWIMFHGHLDYSQKPLLGGRPNTRPGNHGTPDAHNRWFILFYHVWGLTWIDIHWNSIWLRARSHMTSHYTWGSVTTLHNFGGVLGGPLETFFWALTISWSRLFRFTITQWVYHLDSGILLTMDYILFNSHLSDHGLDSPEDVDAYDTINTTISSCVGSCTHHKTTKKKKLICLNLACHLKDKFQILPITKIEQWKTSCHLTWTSLFNYLQLCSSKAFYLHSSCHQSLCKVCESLKEPWSFIHSYMHLSC